ncbi:MULTISPECIES: aminoimidazole riboside kinase [Brenneria]|uniref:Aminoimidazole riboside kinase n=1 Tax=Brenneria nigrifluens DSM 30175 = ATCC 13028 TaxID=1121120 RepID=A0A2U1UIK5_9GAMM|nr:MULTISPECIES: aminoimidazole riboside kinase [Brenneria]EHD23346.1 Fructokinase [Brenneria sp. EniD312]PWC21518.1 aminoimidazole riboside kinase [Brenneria nigrifluens DSM 30175 = ATCC 13028]QCR06276.1 aminoimidazole riboside kinase [Brenneria nigrifluens DSM 30175 = ATCC 13028]
MAHKIWVMGDAVVDLIPEDSERYLKCPGGAPANVAVGIARLGGRSAFIGRVGDDVFGHFLRDVLDREQVDTHYMVRDAAHRTSTVVVSLDPSGERSFTFMVRPSADLFIQPGDLPRFKEGEWLHLCSIALSQEPSRGTALEAMRQIKAVNGWVSFDPNIREDLWSDEQELRDCLEQALSLADVVKLSRDELAFLSGIDNVEPGIDWLIRRYPTKLLLVTLGSEGVWLHDRRQPRHFTAPYVTPVDTTGAGDAFVAGLLRGLAEYDDFPQAPSWEKVIEQAQLCGALATTAKGAMTALPYAQQIHSTSLTGR